VKNFNSWIFILEEEYLHTLIIFMPKDRRSNYLDIRLEKGVFKRVYFNNPDTVRILGLIINNFSLTIHEYNHPLTWTQFFYILDSLVANREISLIESLMFLNDVSWNIISCCRYNKCNI